MTDYLTESLDLASEPDEEFAEDEAEESEAEEPSFDVAATARAYVAAGRSERADLWSNLSDEEREQLQAVGVTGPVEVGVEEDCPLCQPSMRHLAPGNH